MRWQDRKVAAMTEEIASLYDKIAASADKQDRRKRLVGGRPPSGRQAATCLKAIIPLP